MAQRESEQRPSQRRFFAVILAGVAGYVDAVGFLALDLFTAHMSGNSARLGAYGGHGLWTRAAPSGFAIGVFVVSIAAGALLMELGSRAGWRSPSAVLLTIEAVLLVLLAALGGQAAVRGVLPQAPADVYYPLAALAVVAMGLQTSALQRVSGRTVRTTYVSGMLTEFANEVAGVVLRVRSGGREEASLEAERALHSGDPSARRVRLIAGIWCAYIGGALLGGYLQARWHFASLFIPVAVLTAAATTDFRWPIDVAGELP